MPLTGNVGHDIKTEEAAGKSHKQAVAIALHEADDAAPAAGVMFICNGKVLLLDRADGSGWGFTGGSIEDGETAQDAALREAVEEVGVEPQGLTDMGTYDNFRMYRADVSDEFTPILNAEHTDYGWFGCDDLPEELFDGNDYILNDAFAQDARDSARQYDLNGWFEVENNPLSLVGVFPYRGSQIPHAVKAGRADTIFNVLRPEAELNNAETMQSFRLVPWIIDHTMLGDGTKGTTRTDDKIVRGIVGEQIAFDPELGDFGGLVGNVKCFSEVLAQQLDNGKVPLSLGYRCMYEYSPGIFNGVPYTYIQRFIRGNHLASVDDGRMGDLVAVMDGNFEKVLTMPQVSKPVKGKKARKVKLSQSALALIRAQLDALAMDADDTEDKPAEKADSLKEAAELLGKIKPLFEQLNALQCVGMEPAEVEDEESDDPERTNAGGLPANMTKVDDEDDTGDDDKKAEKEKVDAMDAAVKRSLSRLGISSAVALDMNDIYADIAKRDSLASRLSEFVGAFDHSEMSASQVAAYGVQKLGLIGVPKGGETIAVESYLHGRVVPRKSGQVITTAMDGADKGRNGSPKWLADQLKTNE